MRDAANFVEFVYLRSFERSAEGILTEDDLRDLEELLAVEPTRGVVIRGTGGVRKLRVRAEGRGKRGGARVVYFYVASRQRIYLLLAWSKTRKLDLTPSQRKEVRHLAELLQEEGER